MKSASVYCYFLTEVSACARWLMLCHSPTVFGDSAFRSTLHTIYVALRVHSSVNFISFRISIVVCSYCPVECCCPNLMLSLQVCNIAAPFLCSGRLIFRCEFAHGRIFVWPFCHCWICGNFHLNRIAKISAYIFRIIHINTPLLSEYTH